MSNLRNYFTSIKKALSNIINYSGDYKNNENNNNIDLDECPINIPSFNDVNIENQYNTLIPSKQKITRNEYINNNIINEKEKNKDDLETSPNNINNNGKINSLIKITNYILENKFNNQLDNNNKYILKTSNKNYLDSNVTKNFNYFIEKPMDFSEKKKILNFDNDIDVVKNYKKNLYTPLNYTYSNNLFLGKKYPKKFESEKEKINEIKIQKKEFTGLNNKLLHDIRKEIEEKRIRNENKLNEINQKKIFKNIKLNYEERKRMIEQYYKTKASLINNRQTIFLNDILDSTNNNLNNSSFDFLCLSHNENVSIQGTSKKKNKLNDLKVGKSEITFEKIHKPENNILTKKESLFNFGNLDEKYSDNSLFLVGNSKNQQNKKKIFLTSNPYSMFNNINQKDNKNYLHQEEKPKSLFGDDLKNDNKNKFLFDVKSSDLNTKKTNFTLFQNNESKINKDESLFSGNNSYNKNQIFNSSNTEKKESLFGNVKLNKKSLFNDNKTSLFENNDNENTLFGKSKNKTLFDNKTPFFENLEKKNDSNYKTTLFGNIENKNSKFEIDSKGNKTNFFGNSDNKHSLFGDNQNSLFSIPENKKSESNNKSDLTKESIFTYNSNQNDKKKEHNNLLSSSLLEPRLSKQKKIIFNQPQEFLFKTSEEKKEENSLFSVPNNKKGELKYKSSLTTEPIFGIKATQEKKEENSLFSVPNNKKGELKYKSTLTNEPIFGIKTSEEKKEENSLFSVPNNKKGELKYKSILTTEPIFGIKTSEEKKEENSLFSVPDNKKGELKYKSTLTTEPIFGIKATQEKKEENSLFSVSDNKIKTHLKPFTNQIISSNSLNEEIKDKKHKLDLKSIPVNETIDTDKKPNIALLSKKDNSFLFNENNLFIKKATNINPQNSIFTNAIITDNKIIETKIIDSKNTLTSLFPTPKIIENKDTLNINLKVENKDNDQKKSIFQINDNKGNSNNSIFNIKGNDKNNGSLFGGIVYDKTVNFNPSNNQNNSIFNNNLNKPNNNSLFGNINEENNKGSLFQNTNITFSSSLFK